MYDGVISLYDSSNKLIQKVSDKALLSAVTLDTLLGNSSITLAQETVETDSNSSDDNSVMYIGIGIIFVTLANTLSKNNSAIKRSFSLAGIISALT